MGTRRNFLPFSPATNAPPPPHRAARFSAGRWTQNRPSPRAPSLIAMERVRAEHKRVQDVISGLNGRMNAVLARQESEFLAAYRAHMYSVQKELQQLRQRAADAENSLRENAKVKKLEEECGWYRREALHLDEEATAMKKDLAFMREKLEVLEENRDWYARQLKTSRKQTKRLLAELRLLRRRATEADAAAPAGAAAAGTRAAPPGDEQVRGTARAVAVEGEDAGSQGSARGREKGRAGRRAAEKDPAQRAPAAAAAPAPGAFVDRYAIGPVSRARAKHAGGGRLLSREGLRAATLPPASGAARDIVSAALARAGGSAATDVDVRSMDAAIGALRRQLQASRRELGEERRAAADARAKAVAAQRASAELRGFLVSCIEDTRREMHRRRRRGGPAAARGTRASEAAKHASACAPSAACARHQGRPGAAQADGDGEGGDGALRTLRQRARDGVGLGLDGFTATDRRAVVARLLDSEEVLGAVLGAVFPDGAEQPQAAEA